MSTSSSPAARHYASAAFAVALEKHDLKGWQQDMARIESFLSHSKIATAFANPSLDDGRRVALAVGLAGDELRRESLNFLKLLVLGRRTNLIHAIHEEFKTLVDAAEGRVEVGVISARDVDQAEKDRITGLLSERLGTDTAVRLRVDPAIIGGLIVRQGDRVTDGSVRRRLAELRQELVAS